MMIEFKMGPNWETARVRFVNKLADGSLRVMWMNGTSGILKPYCWRERAIPTGGEIKPYAVKMTLRQNARVR